MLASIISAEICEGHPSRHGWFEQDNDSDNPRYRKGMIVAASKGMIVRMMNAGIAWGKIDPRHPGKRAGSWGVPLYLHHTRASLFHHKLQLYYPERLSHKLYLYRHIVFLYNFLREWQVIAKSRLCRYQCIASWDSPSNNWIIRDCCPCGTWAGAAGVLPLRSTGFDSLYQLDGNSVTLLWICIKIFV